MMLRFLVLLCLSLAVHGNKEDDCCSHDDRVAVLHFWETVWSAEYLNRRVTVSQEIFKKFFEHMPDAKTLFEHVGVDDMDSDDFIAHCTRVLGGLDNLINIAYDPDLLHEQLHHLGAAHAEIEGIKPEHFEVFRQSMEEVLPQAIPCFDTEAWERCIAIDHHYIERMLPH